MGNSESKFTPDHAGRIYNETLSFADGVVHLRVYQYFNGDRHSDIGITDDTLYCISVCPDINELKALRTATTAMIEILEAKP